MTVRVQAMACEACTFEVPAICEEWSADQALAAGISLGGFLQKHRMECLGRLVDKEAV